jgi:hypothetical protein
MGEGGKGVREAVLNWKPASVTSSKSVGTVIQRTSLDQGLSLQNTGGFFIRDGEQSTKFQS